MADLLRVYAAAQPDTPALIEGERVVSWAERDERARLAANAIQAVGVGPGGRVALMAYNWGPGNVDIWLKSGSNPDRVPAETQNYVKRILG